MIEFSISVIVAIGIFAYAAFDFKGADHIRLLLYLAGASVIYIGHRLSGSIISQGVPKRIVKEAIQAATSGGAQNVHRIGSWTILPWGDISATSSEVNDYAAFIEPYSDKIALAYSKKLRVLFMNLNHLSKAMSGRLARALVNDWGTVTGAIGKLGFTWIKLEDWEGRREELGNSLRRRHMR